MYPANAINVSTYTSKDLQREAVRIARNYRKSERVRTKVDHWAIRVSNTGTVQLVVSLQAGFSIKEVTQAL